MVTDDLMDQAHKVNVEANPLYMLMICDNIKSKYEVSLKHRDFWAIYYSSVPRIVSEDLVIAVQDWRLKGFFDEEIVHLCNKKYGGIQVEEAREQSSGHKMAPSGTETRPPPLDLSHHFSDVTKNRDASSTKKFYKYFSIPGIGNLAGGLPNWNYFPYDSLEATVALPDRFKPTPNEPVDPPTSFLRRLSLSNGPVSSRLIIPKDSSEPDILRKIDLKTALQYGTAQGYPPLYEFLHQFTTENLHPNIPYAGGPEIILSCGNTDGMSKALEALTNVWIEGRDPITSREGILVEGFTYMNAMTSVKPRGLNIVPVAVDDEGMMAYGEGGLEYVLENWDTSRGKRPHLIYTITIGQNPTAGVLGVQRRKEIYSLCQKYDIIIIEDDPYWYLQYPSANPLSDTESTDPPKVNYNAAGRSSGFEFLDSLVPSYLSVDTEGRVVRLDTFSKTVAPGCRLGWITAQPALIERLLRITECSTQQPSGFVQSMIAQLIMGPPQTSNGARGGAKDGLGWKVDGWVRWLAGLRGNYERRMQTMCSVLDEGKYLVKTGRRPSISSISDEVWSVVEKTKMFDFTWPMGGMFLWVRICLETHPLFRKVEHADLAQALWVHLTKPPYLILASPGTMFSPTEEIKNRRGWSYFRLCFAAVDEPDVRKTSERFVAGFKSFWKVKHPRDIEEEAKVAKGMDWTLMSC
ncbi:MAG: hypothetical protein M1834_008468 [Cirrosporium novae-zelandiae]|nr:MAG: hypothetical protein M1834_008468 [Cirrosporium novae-zelandiae]